jgi:HD-GYP domain-containing protein (c-di-GMP phosphodiesterase class II)
LPQKLIDNPKIFNKFELKIVRQHVEFSVEILKETKDIGDDVLKMVSTHHERHDGSGYPKGLAGSSIPIFGKIAGIVDCYVAIISERPFVPQLSPHDAVKKLYEWRNVDFQPELVEQFIQVIGIYPVGTLVELTDGQVGVIVAQNREWRLKPRVMLLRDTDKRPLDEFNIIDLYQQAANDEEEPLHIKTVVAPGMYGIDPDEFYL